MRISDDPKGKFRQNTKFPAVIRVFREDSQFRRLVVSTVIRAEDGSGLAQRVERLMRPTPRRWFMKALTGSFVSALLLGAILLVPPPLASQPVPSTSQSQRRAIILVVGLPDSWETRLQAPFATDSLRTLQAGRYGSSRRRTFTPISVWPVT